tara:strand:- start:278 stop:814 length:537 start_codon:yes stop_codon:yes gene_type:complete
MVRNLSIIFLIAYTANAFGEKPITVAGLNLSMSAADIIAVAKAKSLRCFPARGSGKTTGERGYSCCKTGICTNFRKTSGISFRFKTGTKSVKRIDISCSVTNSCGLEIGEIARILVDKGIVDYLAYEVVPIIEVNLGRYRGKGPTGDEITVNPNLKTSILDGGITLRLRRKVDRQTTF